MAIPLSSDRVTTALSFSSTSKLGGTKLTVTTVGGKYASDATYGEIHREKQL